MLSVNISGGSEMKSISFGKRSVYGMYSNHFGLGFEGLGIILHASCRIIVAGHKYEAGTFRLEVGEQT